ncbi:hypothetical protein PInf_014153 [Phytophthora infestans]|nr:hypothetical protein PInf_014153 [Phytophthora infestans]
MFERSLNLTGEEDFDNNEEKMQSLVITYQKVANEWRQLPQKTSELKVEQRSREMLVMWIAFCLVHKRCVSQVPLCAEYNIALDWKDLRVAVLRDRAAISALQRVAKYIRSWNEETKGLPLFDLTNQSATFGFARKFGLNSASIVDTYDREVNIWEAHVKRVTLNPFNATSKSVTDSFIEQMPQLPEEFEKSLFIALGSMRSYPFQQFRKLQCVLLDDKLPWSHSCVEIIVRQTLYQIGELTAEEDPEMLWKTDMLQVNLFTGVVLTDGNAPGGLPANIRVHERFQSLFGRCNFEVNTVNGLFQTESLYCGRLYEFGYHESEELFVQELIVDSRNISVKRLVCKAKRSADVSDAQLVDELLNVRQWQSVTFPIGWRSKWKDDYRSDTNSLSSLNISSTSQEPVHLGIFEQPFHRQIELNSRSLELMRDILDEMKLFGGIQMVSPAHRMSLELKRLELDKDASLVSTLDEILDNDQFVDVLDECDALLHHKYHLVYARQQYSQWFSSVKSGLDDETRNALGDVRHISLADTRQFESLCNAYKFCIDAINFYLNTCVFPRDTTQYPQRLSRTAWNLAAGANNIGFSGTNDNHRLLPLSVAQCEPHEPSLLGTNGKMIDKMLRVTQGYEVIRPSPRRNSVPWESALLFAMDKKTQALIDTGALLAGVSNHEAAAFLLQQSTFGFAGVTYYDSRKPYNCWMIAEKSRRVVMPLKKASMLESETFVIFDEARSRGSDMKLPSNASAVLTLGPKLTKDKLMQGAGRMRQLGCNQTLWIASFDEVAQSLLQSSKEREITHLTAIDVLNWVMDNTKAESVRGLLEWASNGIHFQKTQLNHETELVNEDWSLKTLYQEKITEDKIARVIEAKARFGVEGVDDALIAEICRRGCVYGMDDEVCITAHTDECERELHVEEEEEHEQEREVAVSRPRKEKTWNYSSILGARSIENLYGIVDVMTDLAWTRSKLFGTENFFTTIVARKGMDHLNEFLRLIDVMLIFENGQVLLVSECEADHILGLLWANNCNCSFRLVNFAFVCEAIDRIGAQAQFRDVAMARGSHLDADVPHLSIAACHVFNGETMPQAANKLHWNWHLVIFSNL